MPLDTAQKRRSMMGFGKYPRFNLPIPDGGDMQQEGERKHLLYLYSGISSRVAATPAAGIVLIPPSPQSDPVDFNTVPRTIFRPVLVDPRILDDEDQGIVISVDHLSPRFENIGFFESTPNDPVSVPKDATTDVTITVTMREDMRDKPIRNGWNLFLNDLGIHDELFRNETSNCLGQRVAETVIPKADWNSFARSDRVVDVRFRNPARPNPDQPCVEAFVQWRVAFDYIGAAAALDGGHYHSFASEDPTFFAADGTLIQTGVEATSFGELVFDPVSASFVFVHKQFDVETRGGWTVIDGAVAVVVTGGIKGQTILHSSGGGCSII